MKQSFFFLAFLMAVGGCAPNNQPSDSRAPAESAEAIVSETLCFQRYSGLTNQDTASVKLIIDGSEVTGQYTNLPYQKDGRFGTIAGLKKGDLITGMWYYQQEGVDDSLAVEFKLQDDKLLQKNTSFDMETGREFLSDTTSFNLEYQKVDCETVRFSARRN